MKSKVNLGISGYLTLHFKDMSKIEIKETVEYVRNGELVKINDILYHVYENISGIFVNEESIDRDTMNVNVPIGSLKPDKQKIITSIIEEVLAKNPEYLI